MTSISYDRGTFNYVLMASILLVPVAHASSSDEAIEANTRLPHRVIYSDEICPTFDNYSSLTRGPLTNYLLKKPRGQINLTNITTPRTELGRKLLAHRQAALAKGMKLLSEDEINSMIEEIRGERA